MKNQPIRLILLLALLLGGNLAYGQDSLGPKPKKARTADDYKPRSLKEVAAKGPDAESGLDGEGKIVVQGDILPSRVRATYKGSARPLPQIKKDVLHRWAQRYAGAPEHYTGPYEMELLFCEDGREHWLAVRKESVAQFERDLKKGDVLDLFLIRLGWAEIAGEWRPLLLVESFLKP